MRDVSTNIGLITEQGDLGFGFDPLNESDQAQYDKATKPSKDEDKDE